MRSYSMCNYKFCNETSPLPPFVYYRNTENSQEPLLLLLKDLPLNAKNIKKKEKY